jgi:hypothetical protein
MHLRLMVVQDLLEGALDECAPGRIRTLSLCAGQGRDLITVARRHRRGADITGRLVERDARNVSAARRAMSAAGVQGLEIVEDDAGRSDAYVGATPADIVLACGFFGRIAEIDIKATVEFLPALCAPGAWVIWTKGPRRDGIIERIEGWFADVGFERRALVVPDGNQFGVGAVQYRGDRVELRPGIKLFEFVR